ncbi:TetR family transcriptional regulator [Nocardia fluminea]|uniref:TetR/AcrR family transcriptional regulator n=1 Tax=Nocardia fluminea TaxID=134984 RepID=UPI0033D1A846
MPRLSRAESVLRTRAALLTAAEEVFADKGFAEATLDDIAERAGFSRGAVYANFANKTELFLALLDDWLQLEIDSRLRLNDPSHTPQQDIDALAGHGGNRFADSKRFLLLIEFRLYALRHPEVAQRLRDYDRASTDWFAAVIEEVAVASQIPLPAPVRQIALLVLALEHGIATLAHTDPERVPHEAFLDSLTLLNRALTALAQTDTSHGEPTENLSGDSGQPIS